MAIPLQTPPTGGAPITDADYDYQNNILTTFLNELNSKQLLLTEWDTLTEPEIASGVNIQHGGARYRATSNTAITGAPANGRVYIKIAVSGSAIVASFVNSAAGYTWSYIYNGFYHADESQLLPYVLWKDTADYYKYTLDYSMDKFDITADIIIKKVLEIGGWDMDAVQDFYIDLSDNNLLFDLICDIEAFILDDSADRLYSIDYRQLIGADEMPVGYIRLRKTEDDIHIYRVNGCLFDSVSYNDTGVNRGYVSLVIKV